MLRILTALAFCASAAVAQDSGPILTEDGQPVKVIIGTKVITSNTMPKLPHSPMPLASTESATLEVLPMPRILVTDEAATPRRVGLLPHLLVETVGHVETQRSHIQHATHNSLGDSAPNMLHDSIRENPVPTVSSPLPPQEVRITHTAATTEAPHFTTVVMQQTVAILIAVVILALVTLVAYFFVLRKYVPFHSLFQVQVVGSGGVPFMPAALATSEPTTDPFADVTPNFELGPTYEEEMAMKALASERQEMAVLAHLADLNATIQQELHEQGFLNAETTECTALETLTQTEDPMTHPEPAV